MKLIPLTNGNSVIVDDIDYDYLMQWNWYQKTDNSGHTKIRRTDNLNIYIHKVIAERMNLNGDLIDHRDRNTFNNKRQNLRNATYTESCINVSKQTKRKTSSKFKGISWNKVNKKWVAYITIDNEREFIGYFDNEIRAAIAYDVWAAKFFKKFAALNFPSHCFVNMTPDNAAQFVREIEEELKMKEKNNE